MTLHRAGVRMLVTCCLFGGAADLSAAPPELSPAFPPSQLRPSLGDFITGMPLSYKMQVARTPKLMRPPFAAQPVDTPKGLACKIKAQQCDVKNRVKAVRFLGTQDCLDANSAVAVDGKPAQPQPSEAQKILIDTMNSDPSEVVRYEAVKALQVQLSRDPCKREKRNDRGRFDGCLGCCNAIVLEALSKRAYEKDAFDCFVEPSARVRNAAIQAMAICGIECYPAQGTAVPPPPVRPKTGEVEEIPKTKPGEIEEIPNNPNPATDPPPAPADEGASRFEKPSLLQVQQIEELPVKNPRDFQKMRCLGGHCPVALLDSKLIKGKSEFGSVYHDRSYYFSTAEAKQEFDRDPAKYAPAHAGIDLVHLKETGEKFEGNYLCIHNEQLYYFFTFENRAKFMEHPEDFVPGN